MSKRLKKPIWIVGVDEVGRGPLAGPVYVCAAAMLYKNYKKIDWKDINDSKKMSIKRREECFNKAAEMKKNNILQIAVSFKSAVFIDKNGINQAIAYCIANALNKLSLPYSDALILLDGGLHAPSKYLNQIAIIRGDQSEKIISLASVIAKVARDKYMSKLSKKWAKYDWQNNKGYGTKNHILALKKEGITRFHRRTYIKNVIDKTYKI